MAGPVPRSIGEFTVTSHASSSAYSLYLLQLLLLDYTTKAINMPVENNGKIVTLTTESVSTSFLG